jgi:hypothetical protein
MRSQAGSVVLHGVVAVVPWLVCQLHCRNGIHVGYFVSRPFKEHLQIACNDLQLFVGIYYIQHMYCHHATQVLTNVETN